MAERYLSKKFIFATFTVLLLHSILILKCSADDSNSKVITDDAGTLKNVASPSHSSVDGSKPNDSYHVTTEETHENGNDSDSHGEGLVVASWNYHEIRDPFIFTVILILAALCKIVYHHAGFLSSKVPESCVLIILGILFGTIIHFADARDTFPTFFKPHEFFVFLLPPIILEASFSLHDRTFAENLGSILLFAVVGTILACMFLGLSLFGLSRVGAMGSIGDLTFIELMVFSSLIVAVDPVAVLAVFNEIGVNHVLYFLVFGESLLNDGVTVVLYKVFQAYNVMDEITGVHVVIGIVKFLVVCFGGLSLGVLTGLASAFLTKHATQVKVAQPLIIYTMAYLGFLLAELFEFSGIISIVGCGIAQKHYAFNNISDKSTTTINYFTKVISTACETIIFMFLGLSMVNDEHFWHTGFVLWTIILCDLFRFMIIYGLSFLINRLDIYRVRKITLDEQFMIAYGGLRGAVCFSLVAMLDPHEFPSKNMFVTTTLAVIIFTVFVQGITIKPLVYLLQIKLAPEKSRSMYKELSDHVTDHMMAGIEEIIGDHGKNHFRERLHYLDEHYLQPLLQIKPDPCDAHLKEFYDHLILKEHYKHMQLSNVAEMDKIPELPHVATELYLRGIIAPPERGDVGNMESNARGQESIGGAEAEPLVRRRATSGRSRDLQIQISSDRTSSVTSGDISAKGLRSLLMQKTNSHVARYDRNLTVANDFHTEIRKKSDQNRRLQKLFSTDGTNHQLAAQLSWSDSDAEVCVQRRNHSVKEKAPAPRHAATLDLQNHGRQATIEPVDIRIGPVLDSVHEEEEGEKSGDELMPIEGEEDEEMHLKRGGRRSTKHKLERQGGIDTQVSVPQGDPEDGKKKSDGEEEEVKVDIEQEDKEESTKV